MKRRRINEVMCMFAALMIIGIGMVACSQSMPSAEEVAKKIDAKETLSQNDYTSILDYCGEYAKKAQPLMDVINTQPTDTTNEAIDATARLADLYQEYKYLDMFRDIVYNLPVSELNSENVKKVEEYAKYQAFPLPEGAVQDLVNPNVEGDIVDMPDSDSGQVVATGDGEAVDVNVK